MTVFTRIKQRLVSFATSFRRSRSPRLAIAAFLVGLSITFASWVLAQQPVTVTVLLQTLEASQWSSLIEDFEAENPNIRISIIEGPNATDAISDLYTSSFLLGDSPYDLVYMDIVWVPKYAAAGWLLPLSDRVTDEDLNDYLEADLEGGRYDGELYRIPFRTDAGMLYYRRDLLEEAGFEPPETFDDLMRISKALQNAGEATWGFVWQGNQYEGLVADYVEILEGYGGFWIDPDTREIGLDQPAAIASVEFLLSTIREGISPPGVTTYQEEETLRLFQNGSTVFLRNWPYVWPEVNREDSPIAGKVALKAMVHAPGENSGACKGGWGFGIAKSSRHPDEAWKVVEFFSRAESQKQFVLENGYVPSRKSLFRDADILAKYSYYDELIDVVEQSVLRPPIGQYDQASDILQRYLSSALTGIQTPEQAMRAAAAETRRLLS
ncbi:ABC transporter substrate-binding protein [Geitlerinema sp. PCC 7407]|uniref:ABC transporter substrate-binding protein n=1 Tax=Geitlerinema sp. PCC 7407 TaxID=1173025 RepID=UPI00029FB40F|nr:carbohydrate ABC transporter substrate-binding protein, CUT1 family [Geitlerinema sp. PCC 7407]